MAMQRVETGMLAPQPNSSGRGYTIPFILITGLFFLWGLAYGLLDVLNKHFQEALSITKTRSTLLQAAYFGAYFLIALPAGIFMSRYGYKKGIIVGLILYSLGALLFFPAANIQSFNLFLVAVFIIASGLTCLETAANPYVTVLGSRDTAVSRLNLSQCFNGIGSFLGPIIGASLFFDESSTDLGSVKLVYIIIAVVVAIVALIFVRVPLPEIKENGDTAESSPERRSLLNYPHFTGAVLTQFFYVAAQVGTAALFINYCTESGIGIDNATASRLLAIGLLAFTVGRFAGTALMKKFSPNVLLAAYGAINVLLSIIVMMNLHWVSVYALVGIFFFESIMFPTIFALGLKDLGSKTKKGSSFLIMSIVGGASIPYLMGIIADNSSTATAYAIPAFCFIIVFWYGLRGYRVRSIK